MSKIHQPIVVPFGGMGGRITDTVFVSSTDRSIGIVTIRDWTKKTTETHLVCDGDRCEAIVAGDGWYENTDDEEFGQVDWAILDSEFDDLSYAEYDYLRNLTADCD